jgi:hypothetical protein
MRRRNAFLSGLSWRPAGGPLPPSKLTNQNAPPAESQGSAFQFLNCFFFGVSFEGTPSRFPAQAANQGTSAVPLVWTSAIALPGLILALERQNPRVRLHRRAGSE